MTCAPPPRRLRPRPERWAWTYEWPEPQPEPSHPPGCLHRPAAHANETCDGAQQRSTCCSCIEQCSNAPTHCSAHAHVKLCSARCRNAHGSTAKATHRTHRTRARQALVRPHTCSCSQPPSGSKRYTVACTQGGEHATRSACHVAAPKHLGQAQHVDPLPKHCKDSLYCRYASWAERFY